MNILHLAVVAALGAGVMAAHSATGDPEAAKKKTVMCTGCHGIPGYKSTFPDVYPVPRLGGQHPAYIVKALEGYKSGERSHPTMRGIAAGLSEQDMADLGAYYGAQK